MGIDSPKSDSGSTTPKELGTPTGGTSQLEHHDLIRRLANLEHNSQGNPGSATPESSSLNSSHTQEQREIQIQSLDDLLHNLNLRGNDRNAMTQFFCDPSGFFLTVVDNKLSISEALSDGEVKGVTDGVRGKFREVDVSNLSDHLIKLEALAKEIGDRREKFFNWDQLDSDRRKDYTEQLLTQVEQEQQENFRSKFLSTDHQNQGLRGGQWLLGVHILEQTHQAEHYKDHRQSLNRLNKVYNSESGKWQKKIQKDLRLPEGDAGKTLLENSLQRAQNLTSINFDGIPEKAKELWDGGIRELLRQGSMKMPDDF